METPLRIAVCEDIPDDREQLLRYVSDSGIPFECRVFSACEDLLLDFSTGLYDIIFLDIYIGNVQQGVNVASRIRELDTMVTLVFTTFSKGHALEGYRLKVFAYLEKPMQPQDVRDTMTYALNKRKNAPVIKLRIDGQSQKVILDHVLYFEQKDKTVYLNTLSGTVKTSQTVKLRDIEPLLPEHFFRCHQSYIVNLNYVTKLNQELRTFCMQNGDAVYIRRQSLGKATKAFERLIFEMPREDNYEKLQ